MLELIKMVLDTVKSLPILSIWDRWSVARRATKLATIGLELFDLYEQALTIVEDGQLILAELEYAVGRHKYFYESGVSDSTIKSAKRLKSVLDRQIYNLDKFFAIEFKLHDYVRMIDTHGGGYLKVYAGMDIRSKDIILNGLGRPYHLSDPDGASIPNELYIGEGFL